MNRETKKYTFRVHAVKRMFERNIGKEELIDVIEHGQILQEYPDDIPYPSQLILGWSGKRPIHVVTALNKKEQEVIVITTYEPDTTIWERGFTRRKS